MMNSIAIDHLIDRQSAPRGWEIVGLGNDGYVVLGRFPDRDSALAVFGDLDVIAVLAKRYEEDTDDFVCEMMLMHNGKEATWQ